MTELFQNDNRSTDAISRLGVALSDPIRQAILLRLTRGPAYPSELAELVDTTRPNLSNHLSCLRGCHLVVAEREGRNVRYELTTRELGAAIRALEAAVDAATLVSHGQ